MIPDLQRRHTDEPSVSDSMADRLAIIVCLACFGLWCWLLYFKYSHFGYFDWDLAFFNQSMWNLLHGRQFSSLVGINYFGDHSYLISFAILPIFALCPHPVTLLVLKTVFFIVSAYVLFRIGREWIGSWASFTFMIMYLIFPSNIYALLYEYNPENLSSLLLLLVYYFFARKNLPGFLITSLLTLSIKENMCLVIAMFGIMGLIRNDRNKLVWGILPLLTSITIFALLSYKLIPFFRELDVHPFVVRYSKFGHTLSEILLYPVCHPLKIFEMLIDYRNLGFLNNLFGPLAIPAVLSPQFLVYAWPLLMQHLLSQTPQEHTILYHYGNSVVPFIFLAAIHTFKYIRDRRMTKLFVGLMILILGLTAITFDQHLSSYRQRLLTNDMAMTPFRWAILQTIPRDAPVISTFGFLAPLSMRDHLYSLHKLYTEQYQNEQKLKSNTLYTKKPFELPGEVNYGLIDFTDEWLQANVTRHSAFTLPRIQKFYEKNAWSVLKAANELVLLQRDRPDGPKLIEKLSATSLSQKEPLLSIDHQFTLDDITLEAPEHWYGTILPLTLYWHSNAALKERYECIFTVTKGSREIITVQHVPGYAIYPINTWKKDEFWKERYWLAIPEKCDGTCQVTIRFIRGKSKIPAHIIQLRNQPGSSLTQWTLPPAL